ATTEIYTLSLHDALPICAVERGEHEIAGVERMRRVGVEQMAVLLVAVQHPRVAPQWPLRGAEPGGECSRTAVAGGKPMRQLCVAGSELAEPASEPGVAACELAESACELGVAACEPSEPARQASVAGSELAKPASELGVAFGERAEPGGELVRPAAQAGEPVAEGVPARSEAAQDGIEREGSFFGSPRAGGEPVGARSHPVQAGGSPRELRRQARKPFETLAQLLLDVGKL